MNFPRAAKSVPLSALLIGIIAGIVVYGLRPSRNESARNQDADSTALEVPSAELHLRDGKLVRGDETNGFTGFMLDRYASGQLRSRSAISNGLFHGLSQGWHTNGQIQVTEHFREIGRAHV